MLCLELTLQFLSLSYPKALTDCAALALAPTWNEQKGKVVRERWQGAYSKLTVV